MHFDINNCIISFFTSVVGTYIAARFALRNIKSEIVFSWWHNERANALKSIYSSLSELENRIEQIVPITQGSDEKEIREFKERYPDLNAAYQYAIHTSASNSIFLKDEQNEKIKQIIGDCSKTVGHYKLYLYNLEKGRKEVSMGEYDRANELVVEIEKMLKEIQKEFRDSLKDDI